MSLCPLTDWPQAHFILIEFKLWPHLFLDPALFILLLVFILYSGLNAFNIQSTIQTWQHSCGFLLSCLSSQVKEALPIPVLPKLLILTLGPLRHVLRLSFKSTASIDCKFFLKGLCCRYFYAIYLIHSKFSKGIWIFSWSFDSRTLKLIKSVIFIFR